MPEQDRIARTEVAPVEIDELRERLDRIETWLAIIAGAVKVSVDTSVALAGTQSEALAAVTATLAILSPSEPAAQDAEATLN